ncbi:hypothetical protein Hanom_Chr09g00833461 [Helianthus anomalus]
MLITKSKLITTIFAHKLNILDVQTSTVITGLLCEKGADIRNTGDDVRKCRSSLRNFDRRV